jgi:thiol-disulfide isomerase/thioredoxin
MVACVCRHTCLFLAIMLTLCLPAQTQAGDFWSALRLPVPTRPEDRHYLGLSPGATFTPAQIESRYLVVQIFSMYCPICQREAPKVNTLFEMISKRGDLSGKLKLIAIGAGNSDFEVNFYRTTYQVRFPLFSDGDYRIHKLTGEVGTPYFYILERTEDGLLHEVYSKSGVIESPGQFLKTIMAKLQ